MSIDTPHISSSPHECTGRLRWNAIKDKMQPVLEVEVYNHSTGACSWVPVPIVTEEPK